MRVSCGSLVFYDTSPVKYIKIGKNIACWCSEKCQPSNSEICMVFIGRFIDDFQRYYTFIEDFPAKFNFTYLWVPIYYIITI